MSSSVPKMEARKLAILTILLKVGVLGGLEVEAEGRVGNGWMIAIIAERLPASFAPHVLTEACGECLN